eukprot:COSAG06_NODE_1039_length_10995_cov_47.088106_11_plen_791_part_00
MADETKKLVAFLSSLGVGATAARGYADLLVAEGFDTAAAFESLTAEELRDDFGFKRGHLRMVAVHREEIAALAVLLSNPLLLEVLSELSLEALADKLVASGLDNESLAQAEAEDFEDFDIPVDNGMQLRQRMRQKLGFEVDTAAKARWQRLAAFTEPEPELRPPELERELQVGKEPEPEPEPEPGPEPEPLGLMELGLVPGLMEVVVGSLPVPHLWRCRRISKQWHAWAHDALLAVPPWHIGSGKACFRKDWQGKWVLSQAGRWFVQLLRPEDKVEAGLCKELCKELCMTWPTCFRATVGGSQPVAEAAEAAEAAARAQRERLAQRESMVAALVLNHPPELRNDMRACMAAMSASQVSMTYHVQATAQRLTPACVRGGSDSEWDRRNAIFQEGLQAATEAGGRWLSSADSGRLASMRKMLDQSNNKLLGNFGAALVDGGISLFEATGGSTNWLLDYQDVAGKSALVAAMIGMQTGGSRKLRQNCTEVFNFLVEAGAATDLLTDANFQGGVGTVLHLAAYWGHVDAVRRLVKQGAPLDLTDDGGCTPLHLSAEKGLTEVVRCLLDARANVNATESTGSTAVMMAAQKSHPAVVALLIDGGATVNVEAGPGQTGATALHFAADKCNALVCSQLIAAGADHSKGENGRGTPLSKTTSQKQSEARRVDTITVLIRAGAELGARNGDGQVVKEYLLLAATTYKETRTEALVRQALFDPRLLSHGDKVVVVGLANAPQYNYQRGAIKGWNPQSQRYSVFVAPNGAKEPRLVAIRPSNLVAESEIDEDDGDGEDDDL